jgi:hypothetical protein
MIDEDQKFFHPDTRWLSLWERTAIPLYVQNCGALQVLRIGLVMGAPGLLTITLLKLCSSRTEYGACF